MRHCRDCKRVKAAYWRAVREQSEAGLTEATAPEPKTTAYWLDDLDGLVIQGDVLDGLARLADASVDAIVTDPPYGLEFMDKDWDKDFLRQLVAYGAVDAETAERWGKRSRGNPGGASFSKPGFGERDTGWPSFGGRWQNRRCTKCGHLSSGGSPCKCPDPEWVVEGPQGVTKPLLAFQLWCELWASECLRVLKPGGHMVVFGATRTFHRVWCAAEDAGFEVRDTLMWLCGQGFPKSRNISYDLAQDIPDDVRCVCVQHSTEKASSSLVDCHPELDSSGELPHQAGGSDRSAAPLLVDARAHSRVRRRKDDQEPAQKRSLVGSSIDRPSSEDSLHRADPLPAAFPIADNAPSDSPASTSSSEDGMVGDKTARRKFGTAHSGGDLASSWQPPYGASQYYHICAECDKWGVNEGLGTALKPGVEPILLARRPLVAQNVAANVLKHGTGALNIDATRLEYADDADKASATPKGRVTSKPSAAIGAEPDAGRNLERVEFARPELKGRWPANVLLECTCDDPQPLPEKARKRRGEPSQERRYDKEGATDLAAKPGTRREGGGAIHTDPDCPAALLDAQSGERKGGGQIVDPPSQRLGAYGIYGKGEKRTPFPGYPDTGGASRFFPVLHDDPDCPAAMLDEQSGLSQSSGVINRFDDGAKPFGGGAGHPYTSVPGHQDFGGASRFFYCSKATKKERGPGNTHPTVKPIAVMRWLARLVTPPKGVVLDPFAGTGSTLLACVDEGFAFIGIDISPEYCEIALRRLEERKPA